MQDLGVSAEVLAPAIPDRSEALLSHSNANKALASSSNIRCPSVCKSDRSVIANQASPATIKPIKELPSKKDNRARTADVVEVSKRQSQIQ